MASTFQPFGIARIAAGCFPFGGKFGLGCELSGLGCVSELFDREYCTRQKVCKAVPSQAGLWSAHAACKSHIFADGLFFMQLTKICAPAVESGRYLKASSKLITAYFVSAATTALFLTLLFPGNFLFPSKLLALRLSLSKSEQFSKRSLPGHLVWPS
jgi:hypothetical protein